MPNTTQPRVGDLRPSSSAPGQVELYSLQAKNLLRQTQEPGAESWFWALNPYRGCQYGCTFCSVRLETREHELWNAFERRIGVKVNAVEALVRELRELDLAGRPIVLGTNTEPWQQAEDKLRLTRSVLEALARLDGIDLRVNTRSSLVARDTDLLSQISRKGRVSVTFSLASMDERINRLMEPNAPSALRRFSAMEALAHAGVEVGMQISPVLPGLEEDELGLEALLSRAAHAGARHAGLSFLDLTGPQREVFLFHVDRRYPELSSRFRRVIGRKAPGAGDQASLREAFEKHCRSFDLRTQEEHLASRDRATAPEDATPSQLSLFT